MYNNKHKQVIVAGNDFKIRVTLEKMEDTYVPFDLTVCSDLHVYLLSSKSVDLHYEILQDETGVILATVDYRLVSPNTGYGIAVEGIDENNHHFRWEMKPSEGFYVVTNSSSMHAGEDIYTLDLAGRVGWGDPGYTKAQIDEKFDAVGDDIDRIDQSIEGIDGDIAELDSIVDGLTGDVVDIQNELPNKQDKLTAGTNITIDANNVISATDTTYSAGAGIDIVNNDTITIDTDVVATQSDLEDKQDKLIAGNFIEIDDNEISAVGLVDMQEFDEQMQTKQDVLVSSVNIKTINNESILGAGNVTIYAEQMQSDWTQTDITSPDYIKNKPDVDTVKNDLDTLSKSTARDIDGLNTLVNSTVDNINNTIIPNIEQTLETSLSQMNDTINNDLSPQFRATAESLNDLHKFNTTKAVTSNTNGLKIEIVDSLPSNPDEDTIYIVQ